MDLADFLKTIIKCLDMATSSAYKVLFSMRALFFESGTIKNGGRVLRQCLSIVVVVATLFIAMNVRGTLN